MDNRDFVNLFKNEENKKLYKENLQNTKDKLQEMTLAKESSI